VSASTTIVTGSPCFTVARARPPTGSPSRTVTAIVGAGSATVVVAAGVVSLVVSVSAAVVVSPCVPVDAATVSVVAASSSSEGRRTRNRTIAAITPPAISSSLGSRGFMNGLLVRSLGGTFVPRRGLV
jgi:hypothetical protein